MRYKEVIVKTSYPNTISGNDTLIDRIESADIVKIVDTETRVVLSCEDPDVLLSHVKQSRVQDGKIRILVIPFTPGNTYSPPLPPPKVILRKANR